MTESTPASEPERNLLRALKPGTIEIHKALQRLLLKSGGRYLQAPHQHDWDYAPYAIRWPFRSELNVPAVLVFPWDTGTGQSLADFCAYYKLEIPRRAPQTILVTGSLPAAADLAAAEAVLQSPIAVVRAVDGDPNRVEWLGRTPMPKAVQVLDDESLRKELRAVDPGDLAEAFHNAQPKDASRRIEYDLVMPHRPSMVMTYTLIMINAAVFILALLKTLSLTGQFDQEATPVLYQFALTADVARGEWWRFITCGFMHIGILHIVMNMYFLFQFGPIVETILGRNRFLTVYWLGLLGSSLFSFGWHFAVTGPVVSAGASGALCGIFYGMTGYVLAVRKAVGRGFVRQVMGQTFRFTIGTVLLGMLWQVDNAGHFGGAVAGMMVGYVYGVGRIQRPQWLVKFRWLPVVALFGLMALLAWQAWPRAKAYAQLTSGGAGSPDGIAAPWQELEQLEADIKTDLEGQQVDEVTFAKIDRQIAVLKEFRNNPAIAENLTPEDLADWDQLIEVNFQAKRVEICRSALTQLQAALAGLDASPSAAGEIDPRVAVLRERLDKLLRWPGCVAARKTDRELHADLQQLTEALERRAQPQAPPPPPPPATETKPAAP